MEEKQDLKNIKIVQRPCTSNYKLTIPLNVEKKIRYICYKVGNTEWSGILFTTYKGTFENNDLEIICKDIYVMDIGSSVYTEFDMNPDVIAYMADNPELLECQPQLVHSHHSMSTAFSSTDINTLKEEGLTRNNFVSLIVNNDGKYTAAITRKVERTCIVKETTSYELFDAGAKEEFDEYVDSAEEIEYFYLTINKEEVEDSDFSSIENRLKEVREAKASKSTSIIETKSNNKPFEYNYIKSNTQKGLFDDFDDFSINAIPVNKDKVKQVMLQLLTGSIILSNDSKIDIFKWAKTMPNTYSKRFGQGEKGLDAFESWADTYIEYLLWEIRDNNLIRQGYDTTEIGSIYANALINELAKLPRNEYINIYEEILTRYLAI